MVFLSTLQSFLGIAPSRAVFVLGTRQLTQQVILHDVVVGLFMVLPVSALIAHLTIRIAAKGGPIRSDAWTTIIITLVGDCFLELLLPSLQCLPFQQQDSYWTWLQQSWGFGCEAGPSIEQLLSPDSLGALLTLRLLFMCVGVYLGENFFPIVITGSIASGKSTVANMLEKKRNSDDGSFYILDADAIAHEILLPPRVLADDLVEYMVDPQESVYADIVQEFGESIILDDNGLIDRRALGDIVFRDKSQRRKLNQITHPRIILILIKRLFYGLFWSDNDIVCADIPLLFESGQLRRLFGLTIVVACNPDLQYKRLRKRNPDLSEQQCRDRIASQIPMEEKIKKADLVIYNNGDQEALADQVEQVRQEVINRVYGIGMSLLQMLLLVGGSLSLAVSSQFIGLWT